MRFAVLAASLVTAVTVSTLAGSASAQISDDSAPPSRRVPSFPHGDQYDHPDTSFWFRHRPTPLALELGIYGGVLWISDEHNLQDLERAVQLGRVHRNYPASAQVGVRIGFFPLESLGVEGEFGFLPTKTKEDDRSATILATRAHLVFQLPFGRIVPFVTAGGGFYALTNSSVGEDLDPVLHVGGGLKFAISERWNVRVDLRDNFMQRDKLLRGVEDGDVTHNGELLFGLGATWGRTVLAPKPKDSDGDGLPDDQDRCPNVAAKTPDGCPPPPPKDTDGDGIPDDVDRCPNEAEDGAPPDARDGCPNKDADGDGILVPTDKCPDVAGVAPDGCPPKDTDGDGILDNVDKCPEQPETKNGFEDEDGCPDELPKEIQKFTGAIQGIQFDFGKATLRPASSPVLDDAVKVLTQYPKLRLRISGHTDSQGAKDVNQKLSEERAAAVKAYMVGKGIEDGRLETRGVGPDEPVADNTSEAGRAKNRRIEFAIIP